MTLKSLLFPQSISSFFSIFSKEAVQLTANTERLEKLEMVVAHLEYQIEQFQSVLIAIQIELKASRAADLEVGATHRSGS